MTDPRFYDGEPKAPVEKKVTTATAAAIITVYVTGLLMNAVPFLAPLNDVVSTAIQGVVTAVVVYVVAFWTKHTPRPDLGE